MRTADIVSVTVAVMMLISYLAAPVAAQATEPGGRVPLDGEARQVTTVTVDGDTYRVYRQQNALPYASGVEVYADGERVTDEAAAAAVLRVTAAERVFEAAGVDDPAARARGVTSREAADETFDTVAWRRTARSVDDAELQEMRSTVETARRIKQVTAAAVGLIDEILGLFDWMKETSAAGVSVWDAATSASPTLEQLEPMLRDMRSTLAEWEQAADGVTTSLPRAIDGIERARAGEDVDYDRVASDLETASDDLAQLAPLTDDLAADLDAAGDASHQIAGEVADVPVYGGDLQRNFDSFGDALDQQASEARSFTETLEGQASLLDSVRTSARQTHGDLLDRWDSERATLRDAWNARQSADARVYGTLGGGGAVGVGGIGLGIWRWRL